MFNVFLPKVLERRLGGMNPPQPQPSVNYTSGIQSADSSLEDSLWDVVIYSVGGCPGAIVSALTRNYRTESSPMTFRSNAGRRISRRIILRSTVVLSGKHLPHRHLQCHFRESRQSPVVKSKHGRDFFGLDCDVGDIVWMDSGDFLDKREGFGVWDCLCVVKNVRVILLLGVNR